ncbi:phage integrase SAM-like domain protein [Firmicutes bacterium CAG:94]|nr:phage integrase SAM-like domain protein [Firmicutes bacterium CAG:94]
MANAQRRESSYYVLARSDIDLYLQDVASRGCKQGTLENYRRSLLNFFDWLPEGKQVSREKVYEYQEYLIGKYTSRTVNMKMTSINGILGFLDLREYQSTVKASVDDTAIQPELSRNEYLRMLSAAKAIGDERLYLIIKLFGTTGIAVQEFDKVTVEAVRSGTIVTFPNRNRLALRIPACVQSELLEYAKEKGVKSGPIFLTREGRPLGRTTLSNMVPHIARYAKVEENKCTPRCLQKLYAETWDTIKSNVNVMLQMTYDKLLEQEQVIYGWQDVQLRA